MTEEISAATCEVPQTGRQSPQETGGIKGADDNTQTLVDNVWDKVRNFYERCMRHVGIEVGWRTGKSVDLKMSVEVGSLARPLEVGPWPGPSYQERRLETHCGTCVHYDTQTNVERETQT